MSVMPDSNRRGALRAVVAALAIAAAGPLSGRLHAQDTARTPVATTDGVEAFWARLDSAWNARDADRFSRLFTEHASFAFPDEGRSLEGRAVIHRTFTEQFGRQSPALRHTTEVGRVDRLTEDMVHVDGEVRVTTGGSGDGSASILRRFAVTAVMVRDADRWRIHLLRAFPVPPPGDGRDEAGRETDVRSLAR